MFESKVEDINNAHILYHIDMFLFFTDLRLKESDIDICVTYSSGFGGLEVACWPLVRGFKPGRSRRIFKGEKILRTPSFGGEVKPSVPCRRFAACKRSLNVPWKSCI